MKKTKRLMRKISEEMKETNRKNITSELPFSDWQFPAEPTEPTGFTKPLFEYGTRLRWKLLNAQLEADFGLVIGKFYVMAPQRNYQWCWKYLILLDKKSPSAAWCVADTAWEEDVEEIEHEK